ncbi:hypothetical protein [Shimia sp.]|uniref:hypothetical protein n=1 Tax=Shimia sp. TaxID=1954381 RepID=UPI003BAA459B
MNNPNMERTSASEVCPKAKPYRERSVHNLLYLKAALEQQGELVPTDLLSALSSKGVVV